jgi:hypothetical protein
MNPPPVIAALIAFAAMLLALGGARATYYLDNPNPACRTMRNIVAGAPFPPEPNREETRQAVYLAHGDTNAFGNTSYVRKDYARALPLLQKIDEEGTDALASLPPDTPRIDAVIDKHVFNLTWARAMLGTFYEQGRLARPDDDQAAAYFQKSIDTRFVDNRGCAHWAQPATVTLMRLAAILIYGVGGVDQNRARARAALLRGGPNTASAVFLLDKNALPDSPGIFLRANLDDLAENVRNPPLTETQIYLALAERIALWCAVAVTLFVGAVVLVRFIRGRLGYKTEATLYRSVFAVYDVIHGLVARFGLVAEGLIGCFTGLFILFGGFALGNFEFSNIGVPYNLVVTFSGLTALLGGLSKFVEAARVSSAPGNSLVHGAARPAIESEAHAAARGDAKTPDLHNRTFKE